MISGKLHLFFFFNVFDFGQNFFWHRLGFYFLTFIGALLFG